MVFSVITCRVESRLNCMIAKLSYCVRCSRLLTRRVGGRGFESRRLRHIFPRVIITDRLRSYGAAKAEVLPSVEHLQQKYQNNRAENSHQSTRLRERVLRRFKAPGHAQRFLSVFGIITSHFRVGRHLYKASGYKEVMRSRFALWEEAICVEVGR